MASKLLDLEALSVEISTGEDDDHQGVKLGVDGEPFWRIHITPTGEILTGDGMSPPTAFAGGGGDVLSNVDQDRLIGRITTGSGDSEELTAAQVRTLLNIEDGATADQSAAEILAALLTVDGAGSGLDADLLDGNSSADFATAAQGALADTATQPGDDADTLGSGAAADGQVLTADGAGGAAWEAAGSVPVSDAAYGVGWDGDTTTAPSKNAVYDKIETLGGGGGTTRVVSKPAANITRASTLGSFSTPWTGAITVASGEIVKVIISMAMVCSANNTITWALFRGATRIASWKDTVSGASFNKARTLMWVDESPGTGSVTYELQVSNGGSGTVTVFQDDPTNGSSCMLLEAVS